MNRLAPLLLAALFALFVAIQGASPLTAQRSEVDASTQELRERLATARAQQRNARLRAEQLEQETQEAETAGSQAQREAAALAARVQQSEARIASVQAELALISSERRALSTDLAERRAPLAGLTAALESMSRRPPTFALLQPGSLRNVVLTRATLAATLPDIERQTAGLQSELIRARTLEAEVRTRLAERREAEQDLSARRRELLAVADAQRVRAARATGAASREALRARELAQQADSLDALVAGLDASLPVPSTLANPKAFMPPVDGRVASRFGGGEPGVTYRPAPGALVIAPSSGRVAFAGPYEGYGTIVIVTHTGNRTSLVTELATALVATGQEVVTGTPIGRASSSRPEVGWELRRGRRAIDPLSAIR